MWPLPKDNIQISEIYIFFKKELQEFGHQKHPHGLR